MDKPARRDISTYCKGEKCGFREPLFTYRLVTRPGHLCNEPAEYKVEEVIFDDDPQPIRHPLTQYLCARHFKQVMGMR